MLKNPGSSNVHKLACKLIDILTFINFALTYQTTIFAQ